MADEKHCPTCICGKRAPVQASRAFDGYPGHAGGTVSWQEHLLAWSVYNAQFANQQSADCIAMRGGFSWQELLDYLGHEPTTWEPR